MNVGLNYQQVSLAGVAPGPAAYPQPGYYAQQYAAPAPVYQTYQTYPTYQPPVYAPAPSYSYGLQPAPYQTDAYEATRDKGFGDFTKGFFVGAGKAVYDMGHGLFFLGKTAVNAVTHPIKTVQYVGGAIVHGVSHPIQTAESLVTLPFKVAKGIVKPYSQAFQQGKYGEAFGRMTVDIGVLALSLGMGSKPPTPTQQLATTTDDAAVVLDKVDDISKVVTPVAETVTPASVQISPQIHTGDILAEQLVNIGNVDKGAKVTIQIGNINIGGSSIKVGTINGGSGVIKSAASTLDDVSKVATIVPPPVITPTPIVTPVASGTAGAVSTGAQVSGLPGHMSNLGQAFGTGLQKAVQLPGQILRGTGQVFDLVGKGLSTTAHAIFHPVQTIQAITWPGIQQGLVHGAEVIGTGLKTGADLAARGLLYAAHNPQHAALIAAATGRAGKAAEDVLMEFDLVR